MAVGAVGEFVPMVAIAILLSRGRPAHASLLLVTFAAVAIATIGLATRQLPDRLRRLLSTTLGTSAQFAVRLSILALVPIGLVGFLLVRGMPVGFAFRHQLPRRELISLSLYAATALPLVIVVSDLSVANGWLSPASAAGLVGAAMLSVLACPLAAQRVLAPAATPAK
jgi:hypothetical protein